MVVLGIDIGGAQIRAGMVDESGAILASRTIATPADLDSFLPSLHDAIRWLLEATALPAGVGVGCKGIINPDSTQIETLPGALHFLEGLRLGDLVGLPLDVPVFADNAARVALAAEMVWGAARGLQNVVMLTLGDGRGRRRHGGRPLAARTYRGRRPSWAHHGRSRRRGLLLRQSRLPGDGLLRAGDRRRGMVGRASRLRFEPYPPFPRAAATGHLPHCVSGGERRRRPGALHRRTRRSTSWPAAIAGLLHVFDPEIVIVGGQVADAGADLLTPLREEVWARSRGLLGRDVPLVEQQVADKSGIVGAAGLVMAPRD